MRIITWIFQGILIVGFALAGVPKLVMPAADLIAMGMLWIEDFPVWQVRTIAALEVLASLGLLLPHFIKALPRILVPLAAAGLALTMIGAIVTHITRSDPPTSVVITVLLFVMSTIVAYRRYKDAGNPALSAVHGSA